MKLEKKYTMQLKETRKGYVMEVVEKKMTKEDIQEGGV